MQVAIRRIRNDVVEALRAMITGGTLRGGDRLEEVELGARLGVSRTPVREALILLEAEGWVHSMPNRGAFVSHASGHMVDELYPILAALESAALRLAWPRLVAAGVRDLEKLNARLRAATEPRAQYAADRKFHARLVRDCGNTRLLKLLESHWKLAARFDGAWRRGTADQSGSLAEHEAITAAVAANDLPRAAEMIQSHWEGGMEVVKKWLDERSSSPLFS